MGLEVLLGSAIGGIGGAFASSGPDYDAQQLPWEKRMELAEAGGLEQTAWGAVGDQFSALRNLFDLGPGAADITGAYQGSQDLASRYKQIAESGMLPSQADISQTAGIAEQMYAPQQMAMQQAFTRQRQQAAQQAAIQGRGSSDPIIRAKLAQQQTEQEALLAAQRGAYGAQLAMQQPAQRLQAAEARNNLMQGLATQAMQNRMNLLNIGSQIGQNERNFRLQTATQRGYGTQMQASPSAGQIIGGGLTGGLVGAGVGAKIGNMSSGLGNTQANIPWTQASDIDPSHLYQAPPSTVGQANVYGGVPFSNMGQTLMLG